MLSELKRLAAEIPRLIDDPATPWQTLDVLYEEPRVERVWVQLGSERLYLHKIHPCERPFYHPHPWPSAIRILSGRQRMAVGYGPSDGPPPPIAATLEIVEGCCYEMVDPLGWHSVQPVNGPSLSLMVTGQPWKTSVGGPPKTANRLLSDKARDLILAAVRTGWGR